MTRNRWYAPLGAALAALALAACGSSSSSTTPKTSSSARAVPAGAVKGYETSQKLSSDICGKMTYDTVRQAVVKAYTKEPQPSTVGGEQRCLYTFADGTLEMRVRQYPTLQAGQAAFDQLKQQAGTTASLPGIGTDAFSRADGSAVVLRDSKVLIIDVTQLAPTDKQQVSTQIALQISNCWAET